MNGWGAFLFWGRNGIDGVGGFYGPVFPWCVVKMLIVRTVLGDLSSLSCTDGSVSLQNRRGELRGDFANRCRLTVMLPWFLRFGRETSSFGEED